MEYILNQLRTKGLRLTEQRKAILSFLNKTERSVSIQDLYKSLEKDGVKIDEASVYRFVDTLKDFKILHSQSDGGVNLCRHSACKHSFHYSVECGKCKIVLEPRLDKQDEKALAKILNLETSEIDHITVKALCKNCI